MPILLTSISLNLSAEETKCAVHYQYLKTFRPLQPTTILVPETLNENAFPGSEIALNCKISKIQNQTF